MSSELRDILPSCNRVALLFVDMRSSFAHTHSMNAIMKLNIEINLATVAVSIHCLTAREWVQGAKTPSPHVSCALQFVAVAHCVSCWDGAARILGFRKAIEFIK